HVCAAGPQSGSIAAADRGTTITGNYVTQWQVTFAQTGIGSDTGSNTVVTVDSDAKTAANLPFSKFVDDGTTVNYAFSSPVNTSDANKRYRLTNTPGSSVLVNAATTVTEIGRAPCRERLA